MSRPVKSCTFIISMKAKIEDEDKALQIANIFERILKSQTNYQLTEKIRWMWELEKVKG